MPKVLESPSMTVTIAGLVNTEFPGPDLFVEEIDVPSTPGVPQVILSEVVSALEFWRVRRIELKSRAYAQFEVIIDGRVVLTANTGPAESSIDQLLQPWVPTAPGDIIEVTYSQDNGPIVPVTARIHYTDQV